MNETKEPYYAYMLRLWRSDQDGRPVWRASVESPYTGERQGFTNLEQLIVFLEEITNLPPDLDSGAFENRSQLG